MFHTTDIRSDDQLSRNMFDAYVSSVMAEVASKDHPAFKAYADGQTDIDDLYECWLEDETFVCPYLNERFAFSEGEEVDGAWQHPDGLAVARGF